MIGIIEEGYRDAVLLVVALIILSIYSSTMSQSIAGGDAGEIVAEGCHLGTAHPPGYPLITMLIHALTKLPQNFFFESKTVAYRVNLFCSLCTCIACYLQGKVVLMLSSKASSLAGPVLGMSLFALSPLVWQYAITAEVFALNNLFVASILYLVVRFGSSRSITVAYMGALVCGLALCNQHSIVLYEVPLILWMLYLLRNTIHKDILMLLRLGGCFVLGLIPYLYLPIAALWAPKPGSWGSVDNIVGFIHHLLRRDYGTFQLFSGAKGATVEGLWERNEAYVLDLMRQGFDDDGFIAVVAVVGLMFSMREALHGVSLRIVQAFPATKKAVLAQKKGKKSKALDAVKSPPHQLPRRDAPTNEDPSISSSDYVETASRWDCAFTPVVLLATQLFYFAVFHSLANLPLSDRLLYGVHQRFWMQPNVLTYIWIGLGFSAAESISAAFLDLLLSWLTKRLHSDAANNIESSPVRRAGRLTHSLLWIFIAIRLASLQYLRWLPLMDISPHMHFNNYAAAVLDPLPLNAVLLINYDQQWTSVRYMQICEGFRSDVTAIQLSMMTYPWFESKRDLYPHLTFPGSYHTFEGSTAQRSRGAFTLKQFLDSNVYANRSIFLGGKLSYADSRLEESYNLVPVGLVSQFRHRKDRPLAVDYLDSTRSGWEVVMRHLSQLPAQPQFPQETWEWTIGRDFKDRVSDTAAFMLETALSDPGAVALLVEAVYWLESAYELEARGTAADNSTVPSHLLKNAGLAHMHLVRCESLKDVLKLPIPHSDLFRTLSKGTVAWPVDARWKLWAASRFSFFWGEFLRSPDASLDPQYATIKATFDRVLSHQVQS